MYKGQLEGFPKEVVDWMLKKQVLQGNKADISVFEKKIHRDRSNGGFEWDRVSEGYNFCYKVLSDKNFDLFFKMYPKNQYPKVMLVSDEPIGKYNSGKPRVVFMKKCDRFIAWDSSETLEESEKKVDTYPWKYAIDMPKEEILEMTLEEMCTAFGKICKELGKEVKIKK